MKPSNSQLGLINFLIFGRFGQSNQVLLDKIPNDLSFASKFVKKISQEGDYRNIYLIENLREKSTSKQCSYLIDLLKNFKYNKVEKLLKDIGINLLTL